MNSRSWIDALAHLSLGAAIATVAALGLSAAPQAEKAQEAFALTQAVPDDVFLLVTERYNPEREFLDAYWAEVWQAFQESGVAAELMDLLMWPGADQRPELVRIRQRFAELCGAVDWTQFDQVESAFAERLVAPVVVRPGVVTSTPEMVLLFGMERDAAERSFNGLGAILEALAEEANALAGTELAVERIHAQGIELAILELAPERGASVLSISLGLGDDVLFATLGEAMRADVVKLLTGDSKRPAIANTPRFQAAFGRLPHARDGLEFVDLPNLRQGLQKVAGGLIGIIETDLGSKPEDRITNARQNAEAVALTQQSYPFYQAGDLDEALRLTEAAYAIDPTDTVVLYNLACFHALLGEQAEALEWLEQAVAGGFHAPEKIRGDDDLASLHAEPRFAAAVDQASQLSRSGAHAGIDVAQSLLARVLSSLGTLEYSATVHSTRARVTYSESITALAGDAAESPFHAVLTSGRPVADFARFLPQETVSFAVNSGCNPSVLHAFLEQSVAETGELGAQGLSAWEQLQGQLGFDLEEDLLSWMEGTTVTASFPHEGAGAWVWMTEVRDDQIATKKLATFLDFAQARLRELSKKLPMLAAIAPRVAPIEGTVLAGFHDVAIGVLPKGVVCGVVGGWLVVGSSAEAVLLTQRTARGEHPNVRANEELMAAAVAPDGPAHAVAFKDRSEEGETAAAILSGVVAAGGVAAAAIPDAEGREAVARLLGTLSKLAPVLARIDFYASTASATTFDGELWRTRSVTHYVPPPELERRW